MSNGKTLVSNKGASFNYDIQDTLSAGIILTGAEIKSLRNQQSSLKGSWCKFKNGRLFIVGFKIRKYKNDSTGTHVENRDKELLLKKEQLEHLAKKIDQDRLQVIPLSVYLKNNYAKVELGIGRARKKHDKRQKIKERETELRAKRMIGKL